MSTAKLPVVDVNLDTKDMVLKVKNGSKTEEQKLSYEEVVRLETKQEQVKRWFRSQQVPSIWIYAKSKEQPYVIRADTMGSSYASTLQYLEKVATKHRIEISKDE